MIRITQKQMQRAKFEYIQRMQSNPNLARQLENKDWELPLLVFHTMNRNPPPRTTLDEFAKAKDNQVATQYKPSGTPLECYPTVAACVKRKGGRAVFGWRVSPLVDYPIGVELEAHCVWQKPEGGLVELTPGLPHWKFSPSRGVSFGDKMIILSTAAENADAFNQFCMITQRKFYFGTDNPLSPANKKPPQ